MVNAARYYAVTNRRVIALQEGGNALSNIEREGNKCGTLWFVQNIRSSEAEYPKSDL